MTIIRIPVPLRKFTDGAEEITAEGKTVGEVIENVDRAHNGIKARVCGENGKVKRFVNIYVNDEDIRFMQQLDTPVSDGDELSIVPAIAGGA